MNNIITWKGRKYEQIPSSDSCGCLSCAFSGKNCSEIQLKTCGDSRACIGKWYYKEVKEEKLIDEKAEKQKLADEIRQQNGCCLGIVCNKNERQLVDCPCLSTLECMPHTVLEYVNKYYPEKKPECVHDCFTCKHTYEKKETEFIPGKVYKGNDGLLVLCTDSKNECEGYFTGYPITDNPMSYERYSGYWDVWLKDAFAPVELVEKK